MQGKSNFYFGALLCSGARAEILEAKLRTVRQLFGLGQEMKWTKVSQNMLPAYRAFANVFLDDPFAQFTVTQVVRDKRWRDWGKSEEERFFKSYYVFIRRNLPAPNFNQYHIHVDYKSNEKWYRWSSLKHAINNGLKREFDYLNRKDFIKLEALDSKEHDLLQLVDVLLGAARSTATAPAKTELSTYIRSRSSERTRSEKPKFAQDSWTPDLTCTC